MLSVSNSGHGVPRHTINAPHCVSPTLYVPDLQPGPHLSPGVITKCTQGLAKGTEQGAGPCPLASGLAEVAPVFLHLVPPY